MALSAVASHDAGLEDLIKRGSNRLRDDFESMVDMVDCTGTHSPGIETLFAVEGLYLFQTFVFSDIHVVAGVPLSLPVVDHLADSVSAECSCASEIVWRVNMANVLDLAPRHVSGS